MAPTLPLRNYLLLLLTLMLSASLPAQVPAAAHVVIVLEENHSYEFVIGSPQAPWLNALARRYGLASQYYANTHHSIADYFMLTTGEIITLNDGFNGTVNLDSVVRELDNHGKSWKSYAESLPYVGYIGGDVYPYARHHNPFTFFTDVLDSQSLQQNLVPFSQFAGDLAASRLPQYSFVVPNLLNDAHDRPLAQADQWLQANIGPLLNNQAFLNDGLLIIVFDESSLGDDRNGGGRVAMVIASPHSKPGYTSTTFYQHQSALRLTLEALNIPNVLGLSGNAPDMAEFFTTGGGCIPSSPGVKICSPAANGTYPSPVQLTTGALAQNSDITAIRAYVDNNPVLTVDNNPPSPTFEINQPLAIAPGTHYLVVVAYESNGQALTAGETITIH